MAMPLKDLTGQQFGYLTVLHARIRRHGPDAPGLLAPPKKLSRFTT